MILALMGAPKASDVGTAPMTESPWALLPAMSKNAQAIDDLYVFITILCVISFLMVVGAMFYFMWKYKKPESGHRKTHPITHSGRLEFAWSAIPAVFLVIIFAWGEIGFVEQFSPPDDAMTVYVTGQKWDWTVRYPDYNNRELNSANALGMDGGEDRKPTLIVPEGVPVRLVLTSRDVIHSFFIPVFRLKRDAVPGRYTTYWFEAIETGEAREYPLFCTEYCGDEHSSMIGYVRIVPRKDFEAELLEATKLELKDGETMEQFGARVFKSSGCPSCHNVDNPEAKTGPSLYQSWGRDEKLADGSSVKIDENYVRESILDPTAKMVAGYAPQMPAFAGRLNDEQLDALIAYIRSLK